jgi:hypothetical protein
MMGAAVEFAMMAESSVFVVVMLRIRLVAQPPFLELEMVISMTVAAESSIVVILVL